MVDVSTSTSKKITWDNLIEDGFITTAKIADDAVTDDKLLQGKVRARQSGSATNWATSGATNYDTSALNVIIQCGTVATSVSNDILVTFPVAFSQVPVVVVGIQGGNAGGGGTALTENAVAEVNTHSATGMNVRTVNVEPGSASNQAVAWIAIGPA